MRTFRIHLIRHGATDANVLGQYIGSRTDSPLSPEGLRELKNLKENLEYPYIEKLYSSPMLRCKQTAGVLYPGMDVTTLDELTEYDFGLFDGKTASELEIDPNFIEWTSGKLTAPPEGEDNMDFIKRICLGLHKIVLDMSENEIYEAGVIMHGGAIMTLLASTAVPRKTALEWTTDNGRGYTLLITPSLYFSQGVTEVYDII